MNSILLSIGDELILGQTVDTNSAWLSRELAAAGCEILARLTVADDQKQIVSAIREAAERCDVLIITGGLGPTADDLTRQALAQALGQPLETSEIWLARLEEYFQRLGRPMPPANAIQAMIPRGARMIENNAGTAPGIEAVLGHCRIFAMPGVPREMNLMFRRDVLPAVAAAAGGAVILCRTLHTFGLGESAIAEKLGDLMNRNKNPSVGTTVSGGVVSLRLSARFPQRERASAELDKTDAACRDRLGDLIYARDEQTLQQIVGSMLADRIQTLATAESCTGGLLAKMITDVSGSSRYFQRGWITYADAAKCDLLGVSPRSLQSDGAVSEPVALAMATGARQRAASDYALAITGVAGPDGGTPAKPVGTVCLGLAAPAGAVARTFHFPGNREMIRDRSAKMALTLLRFHLLNRPTPF